VASPLFGEFVGTFILILLGDGVVAGVLLKRSKGENAGWLVVTAGWGLAVFAGIVTAQASGSPDAHLNPAVTLGLVAGGRFALNRAPAYIIAQLLGGAAAALVVVTLLGVLVGGILSEYVPTEWLQRIVAAAFIIIGVLMLLGKL